MGGSDGKEKSLFLLVFSIGVAASGLPQWLKCRKNLPAVQETRV